MVTGIDRVGQCKRMGNAYQTAMVVDALDGLIDHVRRNTAPVGICIFSQHQHMSPVGRPLDAMYTGQSAFFNRRVKFGRARLGIVVGQRNTGKAARLGSLYQLCRGKITVTVLGMGMQFNRIPLHASSLPSTRR